MPKRIEKENKIIDQILQEPKGGAHRNPEFMAKEIKRNIYETIKSFELKSSNEILQERKDKFKSIGENLQPDLVSFETISQVSLKDVFAKKRNIVLICLGLMVISFLFYFLN